MAAVVQLESLRGLLAQAGRSGASLAWIERNALLAGSAIGEASCRIDLATEEVVALSGTVRQGASPGFGTPGREPSSAEARTKRLVQWREDGRRTGNLSLVLEDIVVQASSRRGLLLAGLQEIERLRPGTLDKLSAEKARTKRPVARRREQLYEDPKLTKYAAQIEGGWWVATNNSSPEVEKYLRKAAFHAGLDVEIRHAP